MGLKDKWRGLLIIHKGWNVFPKRQQRWLICLTYIRRCFREGVVQGSIWAELSLASCFLSETINSVLAPNTLIYYLKHGFEYPISETPFAICINRMYFLYQKVTVWMYPPQEFRILTLSEHKTTAIWPMLILSFWAASRFHQSMILEECNFSSGHLYRDTVSAIKHMSCHVAAHCNTLVVFMQ